MKSNMSAKWKEIPRTNEQETYLHEGSWKELCRCSRKCRRASGWRRSDRRSSRAWRSGSPPFVRRDRFPQRADHTLQRSEIEMTNMWSSPSPNSKHRPRDWVDSVVDLKEEAEEVRKKVGRRMRVDVSRWLRRRKQRLKLRTSWGIWMKMSEVRWKGSR
jgi:hypothetical protein